jgi:cysteine desulfurase family protein
LTNLNSREGGLLIYLDNAATSWPKPEVVYEAVNQCLRNNGGSPGRGTYSAANAATRILYEAREELAALFAIDDPASLMFTHNATDAANMALFGLLKPGDRVVTSSMEHNAIARPLRILEARGVELEVVLSEPTGQVNLARMKAALSKQTTAVVINHGSNVTGTLVPLADIAELAKAAGAKFIVDAAQTAGVEDINVQNQGIDILIFSGHKALYGPQGTGGIYVRGGISLVPLRYGGTGSLSESDQQPEFYPDRLESGTPNTPGIAGLLAGVRFIRQTGIEKIRAKEKALTAQLIEGLKALPGVAVYGIDSMHKRTAVVSCNLIGNDCGEVAFRLDRDYGIACRAGLHCAPWAHKTVGTLHNGAIRFSPGYFNTSDDIEETVKAVRMIAVGRG